MLYQEESEREDAEELESFLYSQIHYSEDAETSFASLQPAEPSHSSTKLTLHSDKSTNVTLSSVKYAESSSSYFKSTELTLSPVQTAEPLSSVKPLLPETQSYQSATVSSSSKDSSKLRFPKNQIKIKNSSSLPQVHKLILTKKYLKMFVITISSDIWFSVN